MAIVVGLSQTHGSDSSSLSPFKRGDVANAVDHRTLAPVASDRASGSSKSRAQADRMTTLPQCRLRPSCGLCVRKGR